MLTLCYLEGVDAREGYGRCTLEGCPDPDTCVDAVHHEFAANRVCQCGKMHNRAPHRGICEPCRWIGPHRRTIDEAREDHDFHVQLAQIHRGLHLDQEPPC